MENKKSNVWIGGKDLTNDSEFIEISKQEFYEPENNLLEDLGSEGVAQSIGGNRRDFLKFLGFGLGAATIAAGCDIPVKRALPYVVKPENIVPGVATYYSSTYVDGGDSLPVLVKTREGRPIKIEGNGLSKTTGGGTSARAQASIITLYDKARFPKPRLRNAEGDLKGADWADVDKSVAAALSTSRGVRVVTNTILSPTLKKTIKEFSAKHSSTKVVTYDSVSYGALLEASEKDFGFRAIPEYKFGDAKVIVSFGADFLGTWISPVEYTQGFVKNRKVKSVDNPNMSRFIMVESNMSMTGSNADNRVMIRPSEMGAAIAYLANKIVGGVSTLPLNDRAKKGLDSTAKYLLKSRGKSLVVTSSNNVAEQRLVNAINNALGNIGNTVGLQNVSYQRQGDEKGMYQLINDINAGKVDTVIFHECNPLYDFAGAEKLKTALAKVKTKVAMSMTPNETVEACNVVAPVHHFLESWGDVQAKANEISVIQPTIKNLFDTRQAGHSFLVWANSANLSKSDQPYYDYLKSNWQENVMGQQSAYSFFSTFWDGALHDGVVSVPSKVSGSYGGSLSTSGITKPVNLDDGQMEITFFENVAMGNGQHAANPWLQEMPDPVQRTTWGNYLAIPVSFDGKSTMVGENKLVDGDLAKVTIGDETIVVPVVQQFGQAPGTISLALGYGRSVVARTGTDIGVNVNKFLPQKDGRTQYSLSNVSLSSKVGEEDYFSCVQYHHSYGLTTTRPETGEVYNADEAALVFFDYFTGVEGFQGALTDRSIIYTSSVANLKENVATLKKKRSHAQYLNAQQIYNGHDEAYEMGHHWNMHIDTNACTGCGACVVACYTENNVPVVGKKEVSRHHEMSWLRIDRYFYGDVENPRAVYQPMMCQHCDNAPCENVCPANATSHSTEGLNQMIYNRCVGTRYCANNCPYKVRRFNWLDYTTADLFPANTPNMNPYDGYEDTPYAADDLTRMVLNPDVTVRVRGVIEKCSFCVQKIQEGKLAAKVEGRKLRDGDVKPACQMACTAGCITFGDGNIKGGEIDTILKNPLNYEVLEEVNVRPGVTYTMKVDNSDAKFDA